jgi:6-phosphogluconolactonase
MKFRNFGRVTLALAVSLVLVGGMSSCHYNYTNSYVIVTGSQYNQIASYRLDNDTGQLWPALNSNNNLSSGGNDPIREVLLTGGRYIYVLNHGKPTNNSDGSITWKGGNISVFSIGGDGTLSFQESYPSEGNGSVRLALSAGGSFLYVLDEYEPSGTVDNTPGQSSLSTAYPCYDSTTGLYRSVGDVTVFSIDSSTGRLYLVQNQEQQNSSGVDLTYFPVGCNPIDFYQGSGYLYIAEMSNPALGSSQTGEDIYAYQAGTTGQLLPPQSPQVIPGTKGISVINGSASGTYIYVLDAATNTIYPFTSGTNGQLAAVSGGTFANEGGTGVNVGMDALTTDATSTYLYIANTASPALGQPNSAISAFIIESNGDLQPVTSGTSSFPTGSGPVCIFEDPSHQYIYTADAGSSTITGSHLDPNTGILTNLAHGSTFATVGTPTWCVDSSNVD